MQTAPLPFFPLVSVPPAIDVRELAHAVIRASRAIAAEYRVTVTNDVRPHDIVGDRETLLRRLCELVAAAIARSSRHGEVRLATVVDDGTLLLRVIDRGGSSCVPLRLA
jgi:signal transduction histidine kinase